MKLLIIISSFPTGEHIAGLFLPDLIDALVARGCEVHVLTQNCERGATEYRQVKPGYELTLFGWSGGFAPLVSLLRRGPRGWWLAIQYLRAGTAAGIRLAREWRPDFIFAEWLIPAGLIARSISRRTGIPYAARALGSDVMLAGKNPMLRPTLRRVARDAAVLFADGHELCRLTSQFAGGKPCHFTPTLRRLGAARGNFEMLPPENRFTLCCVGRLHRTKGQDVLLEALAMLKRRNIPFRCYLVGAGEERDALRAQIRELNLEQDAILTGRLEDGDILHLFSYSAAVVIPSRSESIPLVLHEAVSAGRPVVVTDVGDMGRLVREHRLGCVVPTDSPAEMADALIDVFDSRVAVDPAGRDSFLAIFKIDQAADTILCELKRT